MGTITQPLLDSLEHVALGPFDIWARTNMGEARGEAFQAAVGQAWVVKNRADHPGWWGRDIESVCLKAAQFSCWDLGDPNRSVIISAQRRDPAYQRALGIVLLVNTRDLPDPTMGATHYHDTSIGKPLSWGDLEETVQLGRLVFYRQR